jgi:dihydrofolate reductase
MQRSYQQSPSKEDAMGKLIVNESISLDGVMQAPGAPDEDRSGGFEQGGWAMPYFDEVMGQAASEGMGSTSGLLLGRRTYEIFSAYWPNQPDDVPFASFLNNIPKYVASTTLKDPLEWANSILIKGDVVETVRNLKEADDKNILVLGSGDFARTLMEEDLVDEYQLGVHPIVLGDGKRLFPAGSPNIPLRLADSKMSSTGVALLTYKVGEKE